VLDFHQLPILLTRGFQDASRITYERVCGILKNKFFKDRHLAEMANHYSALKRVRQTERRTDINRRSKTRLRHQIRDMRKLITEKNASGALKLLPQTFSIIDRSAKLGVIKKNTAARYKSSLHLRIKALATA
jgi:small subunit ribosomal protein S20